jgi:hypothetical protein
MDHFEVYFKNLASARSFRDSSRRKGRRGFSALLCVKHVRFAVEPLFRRALARIIASTSGTYNCLELTLDQQRSGIVFET